MTSAVARTATRGSPHRAGLAFAGLLVFIALVYTVPSSVFPQLGDIGYAKIVAALSLAALGGSWLLHDRPLHAGGSVGALVLGFFFLVAASATWSLWPRLTMDAFTDAVKYLAIFLLVANVVEDRGRVERMLHAVAWATLVPAVGTIHSWAHGEHLVDGDRAAWVGTFSNPNDLAYSLVTGAAMVLGARELSRSRALRLAYLGVLGVLATALLLTQSRGALLAGAAVAALWAIRGLRRQRALVGVIVVVAGVIVWAPDHTFTRARGVLDGEEDLSAQERLDAWRTGLRVMVDRPLTGVGGGAFMLAWPEYAPGDAGPARTAHNTFVQIGAETGLPSLLLFVSAIALVLVGLQRAGRRDEALTVPARAIQIGLVGFLICSATGGLAFSWPLYLLLGTGTALQRLGSGGQDHG